MAAKEDWAKLQHFTPDSTIDNWGDPNAISADHLYRLDDFRAFLGCPVYVLHGVKTTGHSKASWHYGRKDNLGRWLHPPCATDIIVPDYKRGPMNLILAAERFGFGGIGYYPMWKWRGKIVGGLHVDSRPLLWDKDFTKNYRQSRWIGIPHNNKTKYIGLTYENLLKYGGLNGETF